MNPETPDRWVPRRLEGEVLRFMCRGAVLAVAEDGKLYTWSPGREMWGNAFTTDQAFEARRQLAQALIAARTAAGTAAEEGDGNG